jgi:hypothetical protein
MVTKCDFLVTAEKIDIGPEEKISVTPFSD